MIRVGIDEYSPLVRVVSQFTSKIIHIVRLKLTLTRERWALAKLVLLYSRLYQSMTSSLFNSILPEFFDLNKVKY